jgi:hypothetical protein
LQWSFACTLPGDLISPREVNVAGRGKYDPLREHLIGHRSKVLRMSFARIAELVGGLPQSAFKYPAWWANEQSEGTSHDHCKAWLGAGYKARPNLKAQTVTFERDAW